MPANLIVEMNDHGSGLEDQRALQLALELSMLGISQNGEEVRSCPHNHDDRIANASPSFEQMDEVQRIKRGANMTECVPVPSSEHVAEIVGRQGCKIKALRAKTNTYIKTPVRGEEPVFVVTGRKEDVQAAKQEIQSAADHFSQIRASRRNQAGAGTGVGSVAPGPPSPTTPGQVTIQVRVPYRVVGLVVGPKGATIKRIQQQTHTYIVTPSRDKEPVFEVTGSPENAEQARKEIESHIALRTGGGSQQDANNHNVNNIAGEMPSDEALNHINDFHSNGIDSCFHDVSNGGLFSSIYNKVHVKTGSLSQGTQNSAFTAYSSADSNNLRVTTSSSHLHALNHSYKDKRIFTFPSATTLSNAYHHSSLHLNPQFNKLNDFNQSFNVSANDFGFYDEDDCVSPIESTVRSVWSDVVQEQPSLPLYTARRNHAHTISARMSPVLTDSSSVCSQSSVQRLVSDGSTINELSRSMHNESPTLSSNSSSSGYAATSMASLSESNSSSPTDTTIALSSIMRQQPSVGRQCFVCGEGDVVAALVPCGHNVFCMICANQIMNRSKPERKCPVCNLPPKQAIHIFS